MPHGGFVAAMVMTPFVLSLWLIAAPLFNQGTLPKSMDLIGFFYGAIVVAQRAFAQGQLPFWNPAEF